MFNPQYNKTKKVGSFDVTINIARDSTGKGICIHNNQGINTLVTKKINCDKKDCYEVIYSLKAKDRDDVDTEYYTDFEPLVFCKDSAKNIFKNLTTAKIKDMVENLPHS